MSRDEVIRKALRASVVFNLGGALLFLFPGSIGQLAGLPAEVPIVYRCTVAFLVTLFAGTYAWLARQPSLDRPLVGFAAVGKAGFFGVVLLCWLFGEASTPALLGAGGDLGFAAIFAWWLLGDAAAPATSTALSA